MLQSTMQKERTLEDEFQNAFVETGKTLCPPGHGTSRPRAGEPPVPEKPLQYNGMKWPSQCVEKKTE